jgi:hypothetical protein
MSKMTRKQSGRNHHDHHDRRGHHLSADPSNSSGSPTRHGSELDQQIQRILRRRGLSATEKANQIFFLLETCETPLGWGGKRPSKSWLGPSPQSSKISTPGKSPDWYTSWFMKLLQTGNGIPRRDLRSSLTSSMVSSSAFVLTTAIQLARSPSASSRHVARVTAARTRTRIGSLSLACWIRR